MPTNTATKSKKDTILGLIAKRPVKGYSDFELEQATGWPHQTVSSARRTLVISGLVQSSGTTRTNTSGNTCTVWVPAQKGNI